ncbi:hypothetical protein GCM10014715_79330 [Streptomyces spiralis]|uniref:Uncharacterized protein n=1 Tax=Streptomyces spiralis TaxID=66376 RepID=A0A919AJK6_9ACTN|nr:hypothetical protein GCM10014715_79330 [Streptomyces spiralis]
MAYVGNVMGKSVSPGTLVIGIRTLRVSHHDHGDTQHDQEKPQPSHGGGQLTGSAARSGDI